MNDSEQRQKDGRGVKRGMLLNGPNINLTRSAWLSLSAVSLCSLCSLHAMCKPCLIAWNQTLGKYVLAVRQHGKSI